MLDNDSFARKALVEWSVSRFAMIGSSFRRSNRGMRLSVASKSPVTEHRCPTGELPLLEVDAMLIVPSTRPGFTQQHNPSFSDSDDILTTYRFLRPL